MSTAVRLSESLELLLPTIARHPPVQLEYLCHIFFGIDGFVIVLQVRQVPHHHCKVVHARAGKKKHNDLLIPVPLEEVAKEC